MISICPFIGWLGILLQRCCCVRGTKENMMEMNCENGLGVLVLFPMVLFLPLFYNKRLFLVLIRFTCSIPITLGTWGAMKSCRIKYIYTYSVYICVYIYLPLFLTNGIQPCSSSKSEREKEIQKKFLNGFPKKRMRV
ncbi:hypothetical protein V8C37DRAFT_234219 [Trichoderma ceciliae]